jgi:cytochrome bd-type quinol oxidase subunit 2
LPLDRSNSAKNKISAKETAFIVFLWSATKSGARVALTGVRRPIATARCGPECWPSSRLTSRQVHDGRRFRLAGAIPLRRHEVTLPLILFYTVYVYRVFHGRVTELTYD